MNRPKSAAAVLTHALRSTPPAYFSECYTCIPTYSLYKAPVMAGVKKLITKQIFGAAVAQQLESAFKLYAAGTSESRVDPVVPDYVFQGRKLKSAAAATRASETPSLCTFMLSRGRFRMPRQLWPEPKTGAGEFFMTEIGDM